MNNTAPMVDVAGDKADYRRGYLDAIFEKPRAKNDSFMYSRGYDGGVSDAEGETTTDKD